MRREQLAKLSEREVQNGLASEAYGGASGIAPSPICLGP